MAVYDEVLQDVIEFLSVNDENFFENYETNVASLSAAFKNYNYEQRKSFQNEMKVIKKIVPPYSIQEILELFKIDITDPIARINNRDNRIINARLREFLHSIQKKYFFSFDNKVIDKAMNHDKKQDLLKALTNCVVMPVYKIESSLVKIISSSTPDHELELLLVAAGLLSFVKKRKYTEAEDFAIKKGLKPSIQSALMEILREKPVDFTVNPDANPNIFQKIPDNIGLMSEYLSLKELCYVSTSSKVAYSLFKHKFELTKALTAVAQGNPIALARTLKNHPDVLFDKDNVKDLAGQIFYNVSPFILMTFLCDSEMKCDMMCLIPFFLSEPEKIQKMRIRQQRQYAEIDRGGADLVKMDQVPSWVNIMQHRYIHEGDSEEIPLLENPDGIVCFQDGQETEFYYVNSQTLAIELIDSLRLEWSTLTKLNDLFADMDMNSSRRSNNNEHKFICDDLNYFPARKGVQYERKGVHYCDNRIDFELIPALKKYKKMYDRRLNPRGDTPRSEYQALQNNCGEQLSSLWLDIGKAQRSVIWLLQRLCEPSLYPRDFQSKEFINYPSQRSLSFFQRTKNWSSLLYGRQLIDDLGSRFAIAREGDKPMARDPLESNHTIPSLQLLICCFAWIKTAKARVVDTQDMDVEQQAVKKYS